MVDMKAAALSLLREHYGDAVFSGWEAVKLLANTLDDEREVMNAIMNEAKDYGSLRSVGDDPRRGFLYQFQK